MSKKILISGGPVGANLDSVKIITNRFKGGRMIALAKELSQYTDVTYLSSIKPELEDQGYFNWKSHDGYDDYRNWLLKHVCDYDAVILGAAIANLIPKHPWKGKFPSHDYNEGDVVPIDFIVAPRIINMVRERMKDDAHLFGFKLLDSVPHEELINAAYEIVIGSRASAVFANDRRDLNTKYAVTKEMGEHKLEGIKDLATFIMFMLADEYYSTMFVDGEMYSLPTDRLAKFQTLIKKFSNNFDKQYGPEKYRFGTVAVRLDEGFITTPRGKKEMDGGLVRVLSVNHKDRRVVVAYDKGGPTIKATLNAPLLDNIFNGNPRVDAIVHYHKCEDGLPNLAYAPPGTVRDSIRLTAHHQSFNIEGHGAFLLFDRDGEVI